MGGIWGLAASGGLEALPVEARGLFSGILQQVSAACVPFHCSLFPTPKPVIRHRHLSRTLELYSLPLLPETKLTTLSLSFTQGYAVGYLLSAVINLTPQIFSLAWSPCERR
jgi:hypothetical protein